LSSEEEAVGRMKGIDNAAALDCMYIRDDICLFSSLDPFTFRTS